MTGKTLDEIQAKREFDGIWFLTTFLDLGQRYIDPANISFVDVDDEGRGFSQVIVTLESGEIWRIEVERVS